MDRLKRELAKACPHAPIAFLACSRLSIQKAAARMYMTDQTKKCGLFCSLEGLRGLDYVGLEKQV